MVRTEREVACHQERDSRVPWSQSTRPKDCRAKAVGSVGRSQARIQAQSSGTSFLTLWTLSLGLTRVTWALAWAPVHLALWTRPSKMRP